MTVRRAARAPPRTSRPSEVCRWRPAHHVDALQQRPPFPVKDSPPVAPEAVVLVHVRRERDLRPGKRAEKPSMRSTIASRPGNRSRGSTSTQSSVSASSRRRRRSAESGSFHAWSYLAMIASKLQAPPLVEVLLRRPFGGPPHRGSRSAKRSTLAIAPCATAWKERGIPGGQRLEDIGPGEVDYAHSTGRMLLADPEAERRRRPPLYSAQVRRWASEGGTQAADMPRAA